MPILTSLTLLLACQLAGELLARLSGLPVPGPVLGFLLLFCGLLAWGRLPKALEETALGLLQHLSLLFVPAGVGVMIHLSRIEAEWPAIAIALLGSTLLTLAVTAAVFRLVWRLTGARGER